ncbi:hypothetical protein CS387_00015 [Porphyromonas gingivalis]|nr:hypothetical protein CS387_00015 [Porphyromonas gingivalis]
MTAGSSVTVQPLERQRDNELSKSQARLKRQSFIIDNSRIICLLFFKTIERWLRAQVVLLAEKEAF